MAVLINGNSKNLSSPAVPGMQKSQISEFFHFGADVAGLQKAMPDAVRCLMRMRPSDEAHYTARSVFRALRRIENDGNLNVNQIERFATAMENIPPDDSDRVLGLLSTVYGKMKIPEYDKGRELRDVAKKISSMLVQDPVFCNRQGVVACIIDVLEHEAKKEEPHLKRVIPKLQVVAKRAGLSREPLEAPLLRH